MSSNRRTFLKTAAGFAVAGIGGERIYKALAQTPSAETPAAMAATGPAQRIPAVEPGLTPGAPLTATRWAMVIDVKKCLQKEGCLECMLACSKAHNIPSFSDQKEEIKWTWKEPFEHAFPEEADGRPPQWLRHKGVMLLCNQCDNPPCVRVCPTKATWRRASDGIVMMDMHRCIGCRFCAAACPYGSRSFNWKDPRLGLDMQHLASDYPTRTKGVIEKCNFCEERLAKGLLPACVLACPEKALIFGDAGNPDSDVSRILDQHFSIRRNPSLGTRPQVFYVI